MGTIDLDKLRECVELARELERIAEKVTPMLQLIKELGNDRRVLIPPATDRFISYSEVLKILKVGDAVIKALVKQGRLTPLYVAGSSAKKFRLSEVQKVLKGRS